MSKKKIAVLAIGLTPPLWGWLADMFLSVFFSSSFLWLLSSAVYAIWVFMAFFAEDILDNTMQAIFFLNLPILIVLLLFSLHVLAGPLWSVGFLRFMELFFVPISSKFQAIFLPLPVPQIIAAILFLSASVAGCNIRRHGRSDFGF